MSGVNLRRLIDRTPGGPLLAPYRHSDPSQPQKETETPPGPAMKITGEMLKNLIQNGTGDKTWPKLQKDLMRPPLPFKKSAAPTRQSSATLSAEASQVRASRLKGHRVAL